jgi:HlyD family secretion protein
MSIGSQPWVKWLIGIVAIAALAFGGWWYWNKPKETVPEYRTAVVTKGDLVQAVTATGQLNPVANVQVGSQISGYIERIFADFNSSVTQGQVVARLDASTYKAAVLQAEGELTNAAAALELAQIEAKRADELRKQQLIPEADYDKAVASLHQAEAQRIIRLALLERARIDLSRCTITAPTNGTVISRNVDVGQTVAASLSAPTLFVIANDLTKMQIDAMVSEADIGGVEVGQSVSFSVDAFPARVFDGRVKQIRNAPMTNQNVVTYNAVVEVDNTDLKLKPGMTANVSITLAERDSVIKLPNAAMRFRPTDAAAASSAGGTRGGGGSRGEGAGREGGSRGGGGGFGSRGGAGGGSGMRRPRAEVSPTRTVYTLSSTNAPATEKPQPRQVKLGISDGAFTEVLEGLKENEVVVTGLNSTEPPPSPGGGPRQGGPSNPFGGGMRRF